MAITTTAELQLEPTPACAGTEASSAERRNRGFHPALVASPAQSASLARFLDAAPAPHRLAAATPRLM